MGHAQAVAMGIISLAVSRSDFFILEGSICRMEF